jgi:ADP-ribose pyrophosphatase YjhB (NUDIX family)
VKRLLPTPAEEREILRGFGRASVASRWWRRQLADLRRCSRCGKLLSWRKAAGEDRPRWVCAACGFIAYQNPKPVAATLPVQRGRIWLLRRNIEPSLGLWTYPAGFMEMGETVEDAAKRETWEEIRARVAISGPPRIYSYADGAAFTIVYPARVVSGRPRLTPESQEVRAFRPSEIPWRELAFRSTYHALKDWVETSRDRRYP